MTKPLRVLRGMIGMGLTFSAGISAIFTVIVALKWLVLGADLRFEMIETVLTGAAPVGFMMGVAFSGALALYGRRRVFAEMSLPRFTALGAAAGVLLFIVTGIYGSHSSMADDIFNGTLFALLGAGSAAATLVVARKADSALGSGGEVPELESGSAE